MKPSAKQKSLSKRRPQRECYEVGYARPPKHNRFAPGQSGNPRGRPRGAKNKLPALSEERLQGIVLQEAYRTIKVAEGGRQITISMAEAVIRSMALSAAKGQPRAQRLFTDLLNKTEKANKASYDEYVKAMIAYKVDWDEELERRRQLGIVAPDPIPHPDDIIIDMQTGGVRIKGPFTKEEKIEWDKHRERKKQCDLEIAFLRNMLENETEEGIREIILSEIGHEEKLKAIISRVIVD